MTGSLRLDQQDHKSTWSPPHTFQSALPAHKHKSINTESIPLSMHVLIILNTKLNKVIILYTVINKTDTLEITGRDKLLPFMIS